MNKFQKLYEDVTSPITFSNIIKKHDGQSYVILKDAEKLVKKYPKKYLINRDAPNSDRKNLYTITKDAGGQVSDFLMNIATEKDLDSIKDHVDKIINDEDID